MTIIFTPYVSTAIMIRMPYVYRRRCREGRWKGTCLFIILINSKKQIWLSNHNFRTPIWTAFITYYLSSPTWLRHGSPNLIYLRDLTRHIFSSEYTPSMTTRGEHILEFTSASGMFPSSVVSFWASRALTHKLILSWVYRCGRLCTNNQRTCWS